MQNINYLVKRDDIFVGGVVKIDHPEKSEVYPKGIYIPCDLLSSLRKGSNEAFSFMYEQRPMADFSIPQFSIIRRMFFVLDENQKANDLLYDSSHYPISLISSPEDCLKAHIGVNGHFTYKLDKVLQYFNYPEIMRYEDVLKIQELFTYESQIINCEAFGLHLFKNEKEKEEFEKNFSLDEFHKAPDMGLLMDKNINFRVLVDGPISFSYFNALRFLSNRQENGVEIDFSRPAPFERARKLSK